jgi:hypothetical protein
MMMREYEALHITPDACIATMLSSYGFSGKIYIYVHYPMISPEMFRSLAGDKQQLATYIHMDGVVTEAELIDIVNIHDIVNLYSLLRCTYGQTMHNVYLVSQNLLNGSLRDSVSMALRHPIIRNRECNVFTWIITTGPIKHMSVLASPIERLLNCHWAIVCTNVMTA